MRKVGGYYRQAPGPGNSLGAVKLLFPSEYSGHLHDTNAPELFSRAARFLSHGCVRLPNALEVAAYLLQDDPQWNQGRSDAAIADRKNRGVLLLRPMPVHIVYDAAWVDDAGIVQFREDTCGRDGRWAESAVGDRPEG